MKKGTRACSVCLWATRLVLALLVALCFWMPRGVALFARLRPLHDDARQAILIGYYLCMAPNSLALLALESLLRRTRRGEVFLRQNVRLLRRLIWYCAATAVICLVCARFYLPLLFLVVVLAFLCLVIGVVAQVIDQATALREEHDLTV